MQEAGRAEVAARKGHLAFLGTALGVLVLDQASKALALANLEPSVRVDLVGDVFGLRLVFNPGGAFGLLQDFPQFFFVASLLIVTVVLYLGLTSQRGSLPLGLILGGGLGNLIDRIARPPAVFRGEVVDMLDLSFWPTFNIADASIVIGVALMVLVTLRAR